MDNPHSSSEEDLLSATGLDARVPAPDELLVDGMNEEYATTFEYPGKMSV